MFHERIGSNYRLGKTAHFLVKPSMLVSYWTLAHNSAVNGARVFRRLGAAAQEPKATRRAL